MRSFWLFLASLTLFVSACTSARRDTASLEVGAPQYLEVYEIKANTVSKRILTSNKTHKEFEEKRALTMVQLAAFWKILDEASVETWLPTYYSKVTDGRTETSSWLLSVEHNGNVYHSEGGNAYPGDSNPRDVIPLNPTKRFSMVYHAFTNVAPRNEVH